MHTIDFTDGWHINPARSGSRTAALARAELRATLERVTGQPMGEPAAPLQFFLDCDDGPGESFHWQAEPGRIELYGAGPRGLLYAAYSFLEALGCRWPFPGAAGERLPAGTTFNVPAGLVEDAPALPGRCLIVAHHAFMREADEWIIWAARNRLNTVFFHTITDPLTLGAIAESQYVALRAGVLALARERGMTVEVGGHVLSSLLPREMFAGAPGAFREVEGQRSPDHNLCVSSPDGLDVLRESARKYFATHPEADVYHIWPDDLPDGGWCTCEQCSAYTPSEQALIATNAVAEALAAHNPEAQVSFLAYHDTEQPPHRVEPQPNVCLLWAPRMRCYAHAADDVTCPVNMPYYDHTFRAQVGHFANAAPPRVFEYYLDAVLFKSVLPPMPGVIQRDLRYYRDAGAHTVQALLTGDHPWITPQVNTWLFARLAWNPDQDADELVAEFGATVLGMHGSDEEVQAALADVMLYYHSLEAAYALALDLIPEEINLQLSDDPLAVLNDPPADMADPYFAPPAALRLKAAQQAVIPDLLAQAAGSLDSLAARTLAFPEMLELERIAFELHDAWLRFDLARVQLYEAIATSADASAPYRQAREMLDRVYRWGDAHIEDPRYRANFRFLHALFWQLRLDKIYADHLAWGPYGWLIRARDAVRLGIMLRSITGAFDTPA